MNKIFQYIKDRVIYKIANNIRSVYEKFYYGKLRKNLKNQDFSLFSPNCYAGLIYHRLGIQFLSPTINMCFPVKKQYLKFVSNIKYYLEKDLVFINDSEYNFPVAMLEDIKIVFNHYNSNEEAEQAWTKRKARVNYDNIFIIFDDIADAEYEDLVKFSKINCRGKVVLTAKKYNDIPCAIQISKYATDGIMHPYLLDKSIWTGKNVADHDFNFVKWLNNE